MAIDVGGGANLIDEMTGEEIDGPVVRTLGDILRGQTIVQTYKVMPRLSGMITSCVGAADANINLSVEFVGGGPGCAIGTAAERSPESRTASPRSRSCPRTTPWTCRSIRRSSRCSPIA